MVLKIYQALGKFFFHVYTLLQVLLKTSIALMPGLMQRKNLDVTVRVVKKTNQQGREIKGTRRRNKMVVVF